MELLIVTVSSSKYEDCHGFQVASPRYAPKHKSESFKTSYVTGFLFKRVLQIQWNEKIYKKMCVKKI